jgi:hypothetical protein
MRNTSENNTINSEKMKMVERRQEGVFLVNLNELAEGKSSGERC